MINSKCGKYARYGFTYNVMISVIDRLAKFHLLPLGIGSKRFLMIFSGYRLNSSLATINNFLLFI